MSLYDLSSRCSVDLWYKLLSARMEAIRTRVPTSVYREDATRTACQRSAQVIRRLTNRFIWSLTHQFIDHSTDTCMCVATGNSMRSVMVNARQFELLKTDVTDGVVAGGADGFSRQFGCNAAGSLVCWRCSFSYDDAMPNHS